MCLFLILSLSLSPPPLRSVDFACNVASRDVIMDVNGQNYRTMWKRKYAVFTGQWLVIYQSKASFAQGAPPLKAISVADIASTDMRSEVAAHDPRYDGQNPVGQAPGAQRRGTGKWILSCKCFKHEAMGPWFTCRFSSKRTGTKWARAIPNWQGRIYAMCEGNKVRM